jgi:Nif-specific regulatory protein
MQQYASSLKKENIRLKTEIRERFNLQGIIGSSAPMQRVFALLEKVIDSNTTVLIQGETGTGKELLAKVIHYNGPLKDKPFVAENCGALSKNLLESELFGHVKGAFTGAIADKKGLFELVDGGTVFLDEISDMPRAMQTKLLRVLQEGQIRPVGGSQYQRVNFRLISSTNRNLHEEVKNGNFREDLYYRIEVFPIVLPPLKERKEDIPLLAAHFFEKFAAIINRPVARLTPDALEILMQFDWPGKEAAGPVTTANEIPATLREATAKMERQMVMDALVQTDGNRSQAARILGITRQGLLNKIARYEIKL